MSGKTVAKSRRAGEQPVKSGIHRAAKRIGLELAEAPAEEPDRTDEELDVLRDIAEKAGLIFEHNGEVSTDPTAILREALRSASDDIGIIGDASQGGGGAASSMTFVRAQCRIELALALFEYRQAFGYIESDDERSVRETVEAEQARAAGAAS